MWILVCPWTDKTLVLSYFARGSSPAALAALAAKEAWNNRGKSGSRCGDSALLPHQLDASQLSPLLIFASECEINCPMKLLKIFMRDR